MNSRPFPSIYPPQEPDEEFVWNTHVAKSFTELGLRKWCVVLLQGVAIGRTVAMEGENDIPEGVHLALLCRRSCYNPGKKIHSTDLMN
jgi:hypothetical protein